MKSTVRALCWEYSTPSEIISPHCDGSTALYFVFVGEIYSTTWLGLEENLYFVATLSKHSATLLRFYMKVLESRYVTIYSSDKMRKAKNEQQQH